MEIRIGLDNVERFADVIAELVARGVGFGAYEEGDDFVIVLTGAY